MPTHGLTALPLNLMVNQEALNCQTIPEGMKEYPEIHAHNSQIQYIKTNLRGKRRQCYAQSLAVSVFVHPRSSPPPEVQKGSKRVQQRALIS